MQNVKAKKGLGQHFLKNASIANDIANLSTQFSCNRILEIGPGMGVLTKFLQNLPLELKVVEIDHESVQYLLGNNIITQEQCIEGDFLHLPLNPIFNSQEFCIIGNFPYNISSQIVFKIIEHRALIPGMSGMFQKEVAQRIASPKGSKEYGIISVLTQAFYDTKYHFTVDENEFNPPPKIKSGVISLYRKQDLTLPCDEKLFILVVKTSFNQRRKTLNNSLKSLLNNLKLDEEIGKLRPEQLDVNEFIAITQFIEKHRTA